MRLVGCMENLSTAEDNGTSQTQTESKKGESPNVGVDFGEEKRRNELKDHDTIVVGGAYQEQQRDVEVRSEPGGRALGAAGETRGKETSVTCNFNNDLIAVQTEFETTNPSSSNFLVHLPAH